MGRRRVRPARTCRPANPETRHRAGCRSHWDGRRWRRCSPQPGAVHLLQVGCVADGRRRGRSGGGRRTADDDHAGARGLDGPVGGSQEADVASGIQLLAAPLVPQVLFVPYLDRLHAAAVARRELADKAGVGAGIGRRALDCKIGVARRCPVRRFDDAGQDLQPVAVQIPTMSSGQLRAPGPPPSKSFHGNWNFTQLKPSPLIAPMAARGLLPDQSGCRSRRIRAAQVGARRQPWRRLSGPQAPSRRRAHRARRWPSHIGREPNPASRPGQ